MRKALKIFAWIAGVAVAAYFLWPLLLLPLFMLTGK